MSLEVLRLPVVPRDWRPSVCIPADTRLADSVRLGLLRRPRSVRRQISSSGAHGLTVRSILVGDASTRALATSADGEVGCTRDIVTINGVPPDRPQQHQSCCRAHSPRIRKQPSQQLQAHPAKVAAAAVPGMCRVA
jgi:hypothetical protein